MIGTNSYRKSDWYRPSHDNDSTLVRTYRWLSEEATKRVRERIHQRTISIGYRLGIIDDETVHFELDARKLMMTINDNAFAAEEIARTDLELLVEDTQCIPMTAGKKENVLQFYKR